MRGPREGVDFFDLLFVSREEEVRRQEHWWRGVNNSIVANERKSKRDSLGWAMSVQLSITRRIVLRGFPVPLTMSQDLSSRIEWGQKNVLALSRRQKGVVHRLCMASWILHRESLHKLPVSAIVVRENIRKWLIGLINYLGEDPGGKFLFKKCNCEW